MTKIEKILLGSSIVLGAAGTALGIINRTKKGGNDEKKETAPTQDAQPSPAPQPKQTNPSPETGAQSPKTTA